MTADMIQTAEMPAKPQNPPKKFALITNFNIAEKANTAMNVAERLLRGGGEVLLGLRKKQAL